MVYIYTKKKGKKNYYYLRASSRKNGKIIIKDILYLGNEKLGIDKEKIIKHYNKIKIFEPGTNSANFAKNGSPLNNQNRFTNTNSIT